MGTEWIAPAVTGTFGLLLAIFAALSTARNRRRGNIETRAPDVTEIWAQSERDRAARRRAEDLWYVVRSAFRSYVRRIHAGGSTDLTNDEQFAHDRDLEPDPPPRSTP